MTNDPIVEEIRMIRARRARKHGNDIHRIMAAAKKTQLKTKRVSCSFDEDTTTRKLAA